MMKFNREEGLTLIELLITIAVIAIVAAISVPVITNVIDGTNTRSADISTEQVKSFVAKFDNTGGYAYDATTQTFTGYIDLNGDNIATANEKVESLTIDTDKFLVEGYTQMGNFDEATQTYTVTGYEWVTGFVNMQPVGDPSTWGPEGPTEFVLVGDYLYNNPQGAEYVTDWRVTVIN